MSDSTLPKSVQARASGLDGGDGSNATNNPMTKQERQQIYTDFINKYKQLPDDFLRIPAQYYPMLLQQQQQQQQQQQLQQHDLAGLSHAIVASQSQLVDMIDISCVEAQLVKNYGLLRMDLYCKIRVGHMVCETQTCPNGAKNPKWDGVYQFSLKPGIDSFHLEIYDEKQFSLDEKIAWLSERIPSEVFQGITVERWFPLSGRLGTNKEGSVLLVISHKRVPMRASNFGRSMMSHQRQSGDGGPVTVFMPAPNQPMTIGGTQSLVPGIDPQIPAYVQPNPPPQPLPPGQQPANIDPAGQVVAGQGTRRTQAVVGGEILQASEQDIDQLSEMFPSIDKAIIRDILQNNNNDKEAAIGALLAMG